MMERVHTIGFQEAYGAFERGLSKWDNNILSHELKWDLHFVLFIPNHAFQKSLGFLGGSKGNSENNKSSIQSNKI